MEARFHNIGITSTTMTEPMLIPLVGYCITLTDQIPSGIIVVYRNKSFSLQMADLLQRPVGLKDQSNG